MNTVPISFRAQLPGPGWVQAAPEAAEQAGAALLLLHESSGRFTSNITVTGEMHPDAPDLDVIADQALASLATTSASAA
jgi:hypothetical protein